MNDSNIFLRALDKAVSVLAGPENMAKPPTRVAVQPQSESIGNIAGAIAGGEFGPPSANSPMDKAVVRRFAPPEDFRDAPFPSPERIAAVVAEIERNLALNVAIVPDIATQEEVAQATEFCRRYARQTELESKFTPIAARAAHRVHLDNLDTKVREGGDTVADEDHFSYEAFLEDFSIKQRSVKAEKRRLEMEAARFARPIRLKFASVIIALADHLEMRGRERADAFLVPYVDASEVRLLRRLASETADPRQATAGNPRDMLPFLFLTK